MGLTKQYLRYASGGAFNAVCSPRCNVVHVTLRGCQGRYVASASVEHVIVWDVRLNERALVLCGDKSEVCRLCVVELDSQLAVGYANGDVHVFNLDSGEVECVFAGHKSAVTALVYDRRIAKLFSGARDNEIIAWDAVAQRGFARLSGHRAPITDLSYVHAHKCLVSCSKDSALKFWDLDTKHCFKTLIAHTSEVWGCSLMQNDKYLVTGCTDQSLKVWKLKWKNEENEIIDKTKSLSIVQLDDSEEPDENSVLQCHLLGTLLRGGRGRVVALQSDNTGSVLACHGTDSVIELFYFNDEEETEKKLQKRLRKMKKKMVDDEIKMEDDDDPKEQEKLTLSDRVRRLSSIKLNSKIKGIDVMSGANHELRIVVSLANNTLELHSLNLLVKNSQVQCLRQIDSHGHYSEVRCVVFSSDNLAIASGSGESVRLWNRPSQMCLRTVETGPVVSLCFVPGDRHLLVGMQDGRLLIVDISAGDILEEIPAHDSEIWSISLLPDQSGAVTGSSDKTVKIWKFELIPDPKCESRARVLSLVHRQILQLEEPVLCVKISPNSKFIAVGLLDSTVKIFFMDTFKFYLSLYGHKLPILCLDISYDSVLIATGSADRNIKIWGMDFGDCHKSIFAHDDSVTSLQFIPKTHYIFTCGKDGKIKQWDGDTFDKINTLQGHVGEARCLSVAPSGLWAVSCGADRCLRLWERTEEPLVLGDTQEEAEEELVTGEKPPLPGVPNLNMPSKKTIGSEKAAESILECLEVCEEYHAKKAESKGATFQLPILMMAFQCNTPEDFLLKTIQRIRASDLEESLIILPFKAVCDIIKMLPMLLKRRDSCELMCRLTVFLIRVHHTTIVASQDLLNELIVIKKLATEQMTKYRDVIGYNMHSLMWQQRDIELSEQEALFKDFTKERSKRNKRRKARELKKRSMIVLS